MYALGGTGILNALAPDVLAVTAPYAFADNYSGDVVVNTAAGFGPGGYDLYTALLQESGHAFGVGVSSSGLTYGARTLDEVGVWRSLARMAKCRRSKGDVHST